jgi:ABC-type multidrug transport system fused ATPase/permease subunit
VAGADKIIVLDNGTIAEEGSGKKLLKESNLFARLYEYPQESSDQWVSMLKSYL